MGRYKKGISILVVLMLAISLSSCISSSKTAVATVNGENITKEEFLYYLTDVKSQIEKEQGSDITEDFWETAEIDGKKVIETAKEKALEEIVKAKVARQKATEMGMKLESSQREEINNIIGQLVSQHGKDGVDDFLKQYGLNKALYEKLLEDSYYTRNLSDSFTTDVDENDAQEFFDKNVVRVKHILIMTSNSETNEPFDVDQLQEASIKADKILEKVKAGENFDSLVDEFSEDPGSQSVPDGYYIGKGFALGQQGGMVPAFETASLELEVGETSGIVETDFGFHIIKRYANAQEEYELNKEELLNRAKLSVFEKLLDEWISEAKIEKIDKEYNQIK